MNDVEKEQTSKLYQFFSNPIVGIIGSIASVIGLALAIFFYFNSNSSRDFTYLVHPAKAIIVKAGQLSRLSMTLDGKTLNNDVTAAQFAFWNEGKASIRRDHILQPFTLATSHQIKIIEATIRKKSRELVKIDLDTSRLDQGLLGFSWNILEQGDGAILQIIFAGPPNTIISITGVIEGQRKLSQVDAASSDDQTYSSRNKQMRRFLIFLIALSFFTLCFSIFTWRRIGQRYNIAKGKAFMSAFFIIIPMLLFIISCVLWFLKATPEPPFDF